ncbi:ABC transporter ATP-binding protein [Anoxynatronum sibiricum]|uniref:ABC transporter ATP-binding protein n=1 Tax=Anoxynatronum sibiricum TaxID=210623 RepID=A0ABU9VWD5_9CLOT
MKETKLKVNQIRKAFPNLPTLQNISLELSESQFVSVLGPSGCGKSTLFSIIAGLASPDAGEVLIDGQSVTGRPGRVSFMHQKDLLLPWKSILDNAALPLFLQGVSTGEARERAQQYFHLFGLAGFENYYPAQLSGGMRQRAALLRTFLFSKDILLLDEPFGGLDAMTRQSMQHWLMEVVQELKASVLLITHDVDESIWLSDRVYVLSRRPAVVKKVVEIPLKRPRQLNLFTDATYIALKETILDCFQRDV